MNIILKILGLFLVLVVLMNFSARLFNHYDPWAGIGAALISIALFVWACYRVAKKAVK